MIFGVSSASHYPVALPSPKVLHFTKPPHFQEEIAHPRALTAKRRRSQPRSSHKAQRRRLAAAPLFFPLSSLRALTSTAPKPGFPSGQSAHRTEAPTDRSGRVERSALPTHETRTVGAFHRCNNFERHCLFVNFDLCLFFFSPSLSLLLVLIQKKNLPIFAFSNISPLCFTRQCWALVTNCFFFVSQLIYTWTFTHFAQPSLLLLFLYILFDLRASPNILLPPPAFLHSLSASQVSQVSAGLNTWAVSTCITLVLDFQWIKLSRHMTIR